MAMDINIIKCQICQIDIGNDRYHDFKFYGDICNVCWSRTLDRVDRKVYENYQMLHNLNMVELANKYLLEEARRIRII